jgi:hypothetical protein
MKVPVGEITATKAFGCFLWHRVYVYTLLDRASSSLPRGGEFSTCRVPRPDSDKLKTCGHRDETFGRIYRAASLPRGGEFSTCRVPGPDSDKLKTCGHR